MKNRPQPLTGATKPIAPLTHKERSEPTAPLFSLGQTVATPGALRFLADFNVQPLTLLQRHISGDWGELGLSDRYTNNLALVNGERLLSSYAIDGEKHDDPNGQRIWIITEWDRSVTTLLLPSEY